MIGKNLLKNKEKWLSRMKRHYNENIWFYKNILNCESITDMLNLRETKIYKTCSTQSISKKKYFYYKEENRKRRKQNKKIDDFEFDI